MNTDIWKSIAKLRIETILNNVWDDENALENVGLWPHYGLKRTTIKHVTSGRNKIHVTNAINRNINLCFKSQSFPISQDQGHKSIFSKH
jgi:hypothetical protein